MWRKCKDNKLPKYKIIRINGATLVQPADSTLPDAEMFDQQVPMGQLLFRKLAKLEGNDMSQMKMGNDDTHQQSFMTYQGEDGEDEEFCSVIKANDALDWWNLKFN